MAKRGRPMTGDSVLPALTDAEQFKKQVMGFISAKSRNGWVFYKLGGIYSPYLVRSVVVDKHAGQDGSASLVLDCMTPVGLFTRTVDFEVEHVKGLRVSELLELNNLSIETPELRAEYKQVMRVYRDMLLNRVGRPYRVTGMVHGEIDCALTGTRTTGFFERSHDNVFVKNDPVLIDWLMETNELSDEAQKWVQSTGDYEQDVRHLLTPQVRRQSCWSYWEVKNEPAVEPLIPVHPIMSIYNLRQRCRQTVHAQSLRDDPIDVSRAKAAPLILRKALLRKINVVMRYQPGSQEDIVSGKFGGAAILFQGDPGTGKTVTAEICAQRYNKVLYSIQCSELGLDPRHLDRKLRVVFDRCARWGAVLLLDEADIYVSKRNDDLQRSALVEAFLRVLEYQDCVMFMTTNFPIEKIDPAVINRNLIRYQFGNLTRQQNKTLWVELAKHYGLALDDQAAENLSWDNEPGREIKRMIRLAVMHAKPGTWTTSQMRRM